MLQIALKKTSFEERLQIVCECLDRLSQHLPFESEALELAKDSELCKYLMLASPYNWNSIQKILNALFFKLQYSTEFFVNFLTSSISILTIPEIKRQEKSPGGIFAFIAQYSQEVVENISNIHLIAVEFSGKAFMIVAQNFLAEEKDRSRGLLFDLAPFFHAALEHNVNDKIYRKTLQIFADIQIYEKYFFTRSGYEQLNEVIQHLTNSPTRHKSIVDRARFKVSTYLRLKSAQKEETKSKASEKYSSETQKLGLEIGLASLRLSLFNNEVLSKLFYTRSLNVLINLQNFICSPKLSNVSQDFEKVVSENPKFIELTKVLPCERSESSYYIRSFLSLQLIRTNYNIEFILKMNGHFIEDFFEAIYKGLKSNHMSIVIAIWAIEFFLIKDAALVCSLIARYNILFRILDHIQISKVFDFFVNLFTPAGHRMYNISEEVFEELWKYLRFSGLLFEILAKIANPAESELESKFSKVGLVSEIRKCAEDMKKLGTENTSVNPYSKIMKSFENSNIADFNPFFSNEVFGFDNIIDFPPKLVKRSSKSLLKTKLLSGSRSCESLADLQSQIQPLFKTKKEKNLKDSQSISMEVPQGEDLTIASMRQKISTRKSYISQTLPSVHWIIAFLKSTHLIEQPRTPKLNNAKISLKSFETLTENLPTIPKKRMSKVSHSGSFGHKPILLNVGKFVPPQYSFFRPQKGSIDGYIGFNTQFKPYPYFALQPTNVAEYPSEFKKLITVYDLQTFSKSEPSMYIFSRLLLFLVKENLAHNSHNFKKTENLDLTKATVAYNLLDLKNGSIFKVLYFFVSNTLDVIYKEKQIFDSKTVLNCIEILNLVIEYKLKAPLAKVVFPGLFPFIKDHINLIQSRFQNIIRTSTGSSVTCSGGLVSEPFGELRMNLLRLFVNMVEFAMKEDEHISIVDLRLVQYCFISVFEHKNNSSIARLVFRIFEVAFEINNEILLIHLTVKLSLFNIVYDNFQSMYINNTFIGQYKYSDIFFFIKRFIILFKENLYRDITKFKILKNHLDALEAFKILKDDPLFYSPCDDLLAGDSESQMNVKLAQI